MHCIKPFFNLFLSAKRDHFENVSFSYQPEISILKSVSFEANPGECVAFVGSSGAGKSTIMNLIIGYRRPQQGRILLDEQDMSELDLRTYRRYISVVPQNIILFSGSIRENILYGIDHVSISNDWFDYILEISRLKEFVYDLPQGLDTRIGEYGNRLSGGQKQRIAIARSLIRYPRIIIFDEATSALDTESENYIQEALTGMIKGRTTFMVAHRLSTILKADRIIVLENGEIAESGTFQELMARKGLFDKYYKLQTGSN